MRDILAGVVVTVPVVNEFTEQSVVNALELENMYIIGLTYGAWFKLGMGVALALLIVERGLSIWGVWKQRRKDK